MCRFDFNCTLWKDSKTFLLGVKVSFQQWDCARLCKCFFLNLKDKSNFSSLKLEPSIVGASSDSLALCCFKDASIRVGIYSFTVGASSCWAPTAPVEQSLHLQTLCLPLSCAANSASGSRTCQLVILERWTLAEKKTWHSVRLSRSIGRDFLPGCSVLQMHFLSGKLSILLSSLAH